MRDYSYLYDLGLLSHRPIVEPGVEARPGEHIFARRWQALMSEDKYQPELPGELEKARTPNAYLVVILRDLGVPITQRHATVCASFISWLGTGWGQDFIFQLRRDVLTPLETTRYMQHLDISDAYLCQWTIANKRRVGINNSFRTLEFMLAPRDHYDHQYCLKYAPELSAEDYETVDKLVIWLSTREGKTFCNNAIDEISDKRTYHAII